MGKKKKSRTRKQKNPSKKPKHLPVFLAVGAIVALFVSIYFSSNAPTQNFTHFNPKGKAFHEVQAFAAQQPCKNQHETTYCSKLAAQGNCVTSPGWMSVMCAASCGACDLLDPKVRCDPKRLNLSMTPAYEKGDMKLMFEKLEAKANEPGVHYTMKYLSKEPYIVQFDNFLTDEEIESMLTSVGLKKLKRSTDQGKVNPETGVQEQLVSTSRTSENAWCTGKCERDPLVKKVKKRISDLVEVPEENFENFQLLRYELGQEYKRHHDAGYDSMKQACGPRVLTFFLYLSDVEEGGGTRFTDIDPLITMMPKKGSAILWPSVLSDNLFRLDERTFHQAMPVVKGTKYAANSWIHLYDYATPNLHGCTGSFD
eukprot:maker-scaffold_26-snap-gene-1.2-mRNA-1 protein AED:0.00 eAED:0.00 QI:142/1/1/1/1/1/2/115/368